MAAQHRASAAWPVRRELVADFAEEVFADLPRADQRRWARVYLEGMLSAQGRKSIRQIAAAASGSPTAAQSLQQFINASPWNWAPVRRALARRVFDLTAPRAWTFRTAVLPKRGEHSCGVHRRFVPSAGRTLSCQVGVCALLSGDEVDIPLDWHLLLPDAWGVDSRLRERARIPEDARHQPLWAHILDLVDVVARHWAAPLPVVVDMSDDHDAALLVDGLSRRGHGFLVAIPPSLSVLPVDSRLVASTPHGTEAAARSVLSRCAPHLVTGAFAGGRARHTRVRSCLVQLPGSRATCRLVGRQAHGPHHAPPVWITNLDGHLDQLLAVARLQSRTAAALNDLARDYGMSDFEGRSFPGWHHHMTLTSAAYAYRQLIEPLEPAESAHEPLHQAV